jgi:AcrR family transcriptional regulator
MSSASSRRRAWLPSVDDPMDELPQTARRILGAARSLLAEGGFQALSLQAIARRAGESKGSVGYYFTNKQGLVAALVDSLVHDANRALITETARLPMGPQRIHALIEGEQRIVSDTQAFSDFFEVLPHALREPGLRPRVAGLYEAYRNTVLACLDAGNDALVRSRLWPVAVLMIAVVDGLAIQLGLDPERFDLHPPLRVWEGMLGDYLRREGRGSGVS